MQNIILGASVFFFASALALNIYSCNQLKRAMHVLRYSIHLIEQIEQIEQIEAHVEIYRREGTE